jgi:hypothetical protein
MGRHQPGPDVGRPTGITPQARGPPSSSPTSHRNHPPSSPRRLDLEPDGPLIALAVGNELLSLGQTMVKFDRQHTRREKNR